jgi:hypothetical protein
MDTLTRRSPTLRDTCRRLRDGGKQLIFPDLDKYGRPVATIANVEVFLQFAEVTVIHDEFERRALVQGIPDIREWDDDAIDTVRGTANFLRLEAYCRVHQPRR